MIRVTCLDTESGETSTREIEDDYILVTAGRHYLASVGRHANGTTQLTVKIDERGAEVPGSADNCDGTCDDPNCEAAMELDDANEAGA